MRVKSLILALSCLLCATACDEKAPTGPSVPFNQQFTLAPGQTAHVADSQLRIQFVGVTGDSRCPADAICIQGGDALVRIRAGAGALVDFELHTGDQSRAAVTHAGSRIELITLQPYPFSSRTIRPEDYRAELRVTRP